MSMNYKGKHGKHGKHRTLCFSRWWIKTSAPRGFYQNSDQRVVGCYQRAMAPHSKNHLHRGTFFMLILTHLVYQFFRKTLHADYNICTLFTSPAHNHGNTTTSAHATSAGNSSEKCDRPKPASHRRASGESHLGYQDDQDDGVSLNSFQNRPVLCRP